jgi:hypothetical protein
MRMSVVSVEERGPVSIVTINRSEKLNPEPSEAQDTSVKPL